jgi:hypothetical protein
MTTTSTADTDGPRHIRRLRATSPGECRRCLTPPVCRGFLRVPDTCTDRYREDAMGKHSGDESDDKLTKQQSDGSSGSQHGSGKEK